MPRKCRMARQDCGTMEGKASTGGHSSIQPCKQLLHLNLKARLSSVVGFSRTLP